MPSDKDFVHLHLHTEYSLLDGASRPEEVAKRAAEWDMPAVALTDHGSMFGTIPFYNACTKAGVKPILGVESYVLAEGSRTERVRGGRGDAGKSLCHLTLLAENETGYRNLLKMVSESWLNGFYYKPRMDHDLLREHHEGLIAMSACLGGEIPQAIMNGQRERAKQVALEYREMFGPSNFFLELMDHHTPEQQEVNRVLVELSRETGIELVATNDVHYVEDSDADPQDLLLCIQTGCIHSDPKRMRMSSRELFFRNAQQMWDIFGELPDALLRTREIADRCNVQLKFGDLILPQYPDLPENMTAGEYLRQICYERVGNFYDPVTPEVKQRLDYELGVIDDKGYSPYFLIVWDLIDFAKREGIRVGPGRGSAAGSLAAYVLGITELDPLRYALFFERFLNPERPSAPDIDIDFPPEHREKVVAYTIAKYGPSHTAKIITFGTMGAKAAIKDVGRVLEMPPADVNEVSALVPDRPGVSIEQALDEAEELKRRYEEDEAIHNLIDNAKRLEGLARHTSIHAAALVISREELDNYVPLCRVSSGEDVVTQFDMQAIDQIGLLKMDFLGLRTMTVIDEACRLVRENHGLDDFDVRDMPLDDTKTYELISRGDVVGVFQLESGGFQRVCRELRPDCIDDIVALVALYRPGPMDYIPRYTARKHGKEKVEYLHPLLQPILEPTYGIIVYQEQVMQIGRDLAGFSLGEADQIRKAVGKKDAKTMAKVREQFIKGCADNGIDTKVAEQLMDDIEAFARYAFNKSHSACYALVAYWTAYLKANYPAEFMAAQLTSVRDKRDKIVAFVQDTRQMGIEVLPPCVNTGGEVFEVHDDHIVYGMEAINGVGVNVVRAIVSERKAHGEFADLSDFCRRVDSREMQKGQVDKLIRAGACRAFGNRRQLAEQYEGIYEAAAKQQADERAGQGSLFDGLMGDDGRGDVLAPTLKPLPEYDRDELRAMDTEMLGLVLFENPFADLRRKLEPVEFELQPTSDLRDLKPRTEVVVGGLIEECRTFNTQKGDAMMRARLNDGHGICALVLFPRTFEECGRLMQPGEVMLVSGKMDQMDERNAGDPPTILVDKVVPPEQWKQIAPRRGRRPAARARAARPDDAHSDSFAAPARERSNGHGAEANGNGHANGSGSAPANGHGRPAEPDPAVTAVHIDMNVGTDVRGRLQALAVVLQRHAGPCPVFLRLRDGREARRLALAPAYAVRWSEDLLGELERLDGTAITPVQ